MYYEHVIGCWNSQYYCWT